MRKIVMTCDHCKKILDHNNLATISFRLRDDWKTCPEDITLELCQECAAPYLASIREVHAKCSVPVPSQE